jgi:hypothetical protein
MTELNKFYQIYKLNSEFELGFCIEMQRDQILKFKPKMNEFEPNSIWI